MAEGDIHKHLKYKALYWLKEKVTDLVANEVDFHRIRCIADAVGINLKRKEVRVIEVKASREDFFRDTKLFHPKFTYVNHATYSYILCPENLLKEEEIPEGYGLLWLDSTDNIVVVKKPKKNSKLTTSFEITLKWTIRRLTNTFLYQKDNQQNKDETGGEYKRKADIWQIAYKCPNCKKRNEILVHLPSINKTVCKHCKSEIDLLKTKYRGISGFNKRFHKELLEAVKKQEEYENR